MQAARDTGTSFKHVRNNISITGNLPCAFSQLLTPGDFQRSDVCWEASPTQGKGRCWWGGMQPGLDSERHHLQVWIDSPWKITETFSYASCLMVPTLPVWNQFKFPKIPNWWFISGGAGSLDGWSLLFSGSLGCIPKLFQPFLQPYDPANPSSPSYQLSPCFQTWFLIQVAHCSHIIPSKALRKNQDKPFLPL